MKHSRWTPSLPLSFHGILGMSPSVPNVLCHAMLEAAWESHGGQGFHQLVLLHPAGLGSPTPKSSCAEQADPCTNLPDGLFFHQSWEGPSSRLLQMFGRSLRQEARLLQLPPCHAAAATSLPGCP